MFLNQTVNTDVLFKNFTDQCRLMILDIVFLIKEYSCTNHRVQSWHAQQEAGYIAAFTTLS